MKTRPIRFDDPADLQKPSSICIEMMMNLDLLDCARRMWERKGDKVSLQRADEIRKYYKEMTRQYVYIARALITDEVFAEYRKRYEKMIPEDSNTANL